VEQEEDKSVVLVPEDYRPKTNPHTVADVLDWSDDVKLQLYENMKIVVNTSMIEEVKIAGKAHFLVLENYVLAVDD
tara:strand:+ start:1158 stop:1385 length:228 start_codon:yes stop_codon:yes gene_type:complete